MLILQIVLSSLHEKMCICRAAEVCFNYSEYFFWFSKFNIKT